MIEGNVLKLPASVDVSAIDVQKAAGAIRVVGEKIVVQMLSEPDPEHGIVLPDRLKGTDIGVVIKAPEMPVKVKGVWVWPPAVGTLVCVWPEDGIWIVNADMGSYRPKGQIRVYGVFAKSSGDPRTCDWWDSIVCEFSDGQLKNPFGDKIILELDPRVERDGNVWMPDIVQARSGMATVAAVGPLERDVKPGDRVCYSSELLLEHGLKVDGRDIGIGDNRAILYIHNPAGEASNSVAA